MRALKKEELTLDQKLGIVLCATMSHGDADSDYVINMIKERKCGAVWIQDSPKLDEYLARIREVADYPVIVICDAEEGIEGYGIPQQLALTAAGARSEDAYAFGYITGTLLRRQGFNTICCPVVDICSKNTPCGHTTRTFGPDLDTVIRMSVEVGRGMHDAGIMNMAKHYPGGSIGLPYDTHMREDVSPLTAEELLETHLRPYIEMEKAGVLDAIMPGHRRFPAIDDQHPSCLSRPVLSLLREKGGFTGYYMSDALNMMGVVLKYGPENPVGLAVAAGCDMPLPWEITYDKAYAAMQSCFERGVFTEEQLDECVERVLRAQEKILALPEPAEELPEKLLECLARTHTASIASVCEEGLTPTISRDGKHLFILVSGGSVALNPNEYYPGPGEWFHPPKVKEKIKELFPNSDVMAIGVFPSITENIVAFSRAVQHEDVIFVTQGITSAYIGPEGMTSRIVALMDSLQSTDRIVAHLYFGNPFVMEDAPYVPRVLMGYTSEKSVFHALEILAGNAEAEGVVPYDNIKFHKKGDIIYK